MATTAFLVLGALAVIAVFGIGWAHEYEKRLSLEHDLATSEAARLQWEAHARRLRTLAARAPVVIPGDPDIKFLGGAS